MQVPPHERTEHRGDPGNRTRYVRSNVHRQFAMQKFRFQDLPCVRSVHEGDLQCSTALEYIPLPELSFLQYAPPPFWSDAPLSPREQPPQARKSWTQPGSNVLPLTLARQWGGWWSVVPSTIKERQSEQRSVHAGTVPHPLIRTRSLFLPVVYLTIPKKERKKRIKRVWFVSCRCFGTASAG